MITIPLWLFTGLCALSGLTALLWIAAVVRAERTVDRILAEELSRPPIGDDRDEGGHHRAEDGQP